MEHVCNGDPATHDCDELEAEATRQKVAKILSEGIVRSRAEMQRDIEWTRQFFKTEHFNSPQAHFTITNV